MNVSPQSRGHYTRKVGGLLAATVLAVGALVVAAPDADAGRKRPAPVVEVQAPPAETLGNGLGNGLGNSL